MFSVALLLGASLVDRSADAGVLRVDETHGRLRNGVPVALVGSDAASLIRTAGLEDVQVFRLRSTADARQPELEPPVVTPGINTILVSGIDEATGESQAWSFQIWGDTHASVLLRPILLDLDPLADDSVRLRIGVLPEPQRQVAPIGQIIFESVEVALFRHEDLIARLGVGAVDINGERIRLDTRKGAATIQGEGDCPFILITEDSDLDPAIAAALTLPPDPFGSGLILVISGLVTLPDASGMAFFAEIVHTGEPDPAALEALEDIQLCPWSPTPRPPDPPGGGCTWQFRPIYLPPFHPPFGAPPRDPILLPWPPSPGPFVQLACSESGIYSTNHHNVIWRRSLDALPTRILGSVHVCINAALGSPSYETSWYGCPPDQSSGTFLLRRVGHCDCDCAVVLEGTAAFDAFVYLDPLGGVEGFGSMVLKLRPGVEAAAVGRFGLESGEDGVALPVRGSAPPEQIEGGRAAWKFRGRAEIGVVECSVLLRTSTACRLKGRSAYIPALTNSSVGGDFQQPRFELTITPAESPECLSGGLILAPFTLP